MRIKKLIKELQEIAEKHGDVFVQCRNYSGYWRPVLTVSANKYSDGTVCKIDASEQ